MNNETGCVVMIWSQQAANAVKPLFSIRIVAALIHFLFWINLIAYPTVGKRSMQWLYAYLVTDLLLLIQFFLLYAYRWLSICVSHLLLTIICYCEAIFGNQLVLERPQSDACDSLFTSISIQILFILFSYFLPVILALVFLLLSLKHVRNIDDIRTKQIIDARLKYHQQLVIQSGVFYSLWLLLWSPNLLFFLFYYRHSTAGSITQILSYVSIALDVRFLRACHSTWNHLMRFMRPAHVAPISRTVLPKY